MGLCKCPKRVVTTLFCYEHRVNVCESCLVKNHSSCIIQSYYKWLHDTEYDPKCSLCGADLSVEDCLRLTCYHVFHWSCLKNLFDGYPKTTAPAGYQCPVPECSTTIFPPPMLSSMVADEVRRRLASTEWGRMNGITDTVGTFSKDDDRSQWEPPSPDDVFNSMPEPAIVNSERISIINERFPRDFETTLQQPRTSKSTEPVLYTIEEENNATKYRRRRRHQSLTRNLEYLRKSTYCKFVFLFLFTSFVLFVVVIVVLPSEFEEDKVLRKIRDLREKAIEERGLRPY